MLNFVNRITIAAAAKSKFMLRRSGVAMMHRSVSCCEAVHKGKGLL